MEWSGDVYLSDGSLQKQYEAYRERLDFAESVGCSGVSAQLTSILSGISDDMDFIHSGTCTCKKGYYSVLKALYTYSPSQLRPMPIRSTPRNSSQEVLPYEADPTAQKGTLDLVSTPHLL